MKRKSNEPSQPTGPSWEYELALIGTRKGTVAGVDEVGRGCLAGPVVAAAVILPRLQQVAGLNDSKKLSSRQREILRKQLLAVPGMSYGIGVATEAEIDKFNILQATRLAMIRALSVLPHPPQLVLVDGPAWKDFPYNHIGVVAGDCLCPSIAAASVLAKCTRDDMMRELHRLDPRYDFHLNKGYATAAHLAALARFGPGSYHRRSFTPVAQATLPDMC